jgi:hypothetical protein
MLGKTIRLLKEHNNILNLPNKGSPHCPYRNWHINLESEPHKNLCLEINNNFISKDAIYAHNNKYKRN